MAASLVTRQLSHLWVDGLCGQLGLRSRFAARLLFITRQLSSLDVRLSGCIVSDFPERSQQSECFAITVVWFAFRLHRRTP